MDSPTEELKQQIEQVREKYPRAICVRTTARHPEHLNDTHYRIWPTDHFFETRYIGAGNTKEAAWKDAVEKLLS